MEQDYYRQWEKTTLVAEQQPHQVTALTLLTFLPTWFKFYVVPGPVRFVWFGVWQRLLRVAYRVQKVLVLQGGLARGCWRRRAEAVAPLAAGADASPGRLQGPSWTWQSAGAQTPRPLCSASWHCSGCTARFLCGRTCCTGCTSSRSVGGTGTCRGSTLGQLATDPSRRAPQGKAYEPKVSPSSEA